MTTPDDDTTARQTAAALRARQRARQWTRHNVPGAREVLAPTVTDETPDPDASAAERGYALSRLARPEGGRHA